MKTHVQTNRNKHILLQFVSGIIFVYDVTSRSSFQLIEELLEFVEKGRNNQDTLEKPKTNSTEDSDDIPIIDPHKPLTSIYSIVGMKSESPFREVTLQEGEQLASKYNAFHSECSFIVNLPTRTANNNNQTTHFDQEANGETTMWNHTSDLIFEEITKRIIATRKMQAKEEKKTRCCMQ